MRGRKQSGKDYDYGFGVYLVWCNIQGCPWQTAGPELLPCLKAKGEHAVTVHDDDSQRDRYGRRMWRGIRRVA